MAQKGSSAGSLARDRIMGVVGTSPGIHVRRVSLLTGLSWNTCLHHLRVLARDGQLTSRKVQGKLCWFDTRQGAVQSKRGICLLRDETNRSIATHVLSSPGSSQIHIARSLGLAASVVHRRVIAMEEAGLVTRQAEERCIRVEPTAQMAPAKQAVPAYGPSPMPLADHVLVPTAAV